MHHQPSSGGASRDDATSGSLSGQNLPRPTVNKFPKKEAIISQHVHRSLLEVKPHSMSSKQSPTPSQDSDVWHSESEANWTMVENPLKDITQSQVLSEDEPKEDSHSVHSAGRESKSEVPMACTNVLYCITQGGNDIQVPHVSRYGFEPPRSMEIFGVGSWNSLCIAQNVNLLQETGEYIYNIIIVV